VDNITYGVSKPTKLSISHIALDILKDLERNLKFCVGIGTDG
jgi:hypothetical protein